ncbi:MAG: hypothetical protein R3F49_04150 [Planctomycetota bacterium]
MDDAQRGLDLGQAESRAAVFRARTRRALRAAPLLVAAAAFLALLVLRADFLIDDGFIAFRHARNWAEHGVPTFNLGVSPPVEGYSDFLWVALLAAAHAVGLSIPATAKVLGALAGLATLALFTRHARRHEGLTGAPLLLATLFVATAPAFVVWSSGGLETALFTLLAFATFSALVSSGGSARSGSSGNSGNSGNSGSPGSSGSSGGAGGAGSAGASSPGEDAHDAAQSADERNPRAALVGGLLGGAAALGVALVRVEGFLWVLVLFAAAAAARGARAASGRRFATAFGVYLVGFVAFLLWRHGVYGDWLANTAGAKLGVSAERLARGAKYSATFGLAAVSPIAALVGGFALLARGVRREATGALVCVALAFLGYTVLVGGDWMPFWRFLAPATPFFALLLGRALADLPRSAAARAGATLVGALLVAVQTLPLFDASVAPRAWLEALSYRGFRGPWKSEWERLVTARENGAQFEQLGRALAQVVTKDDSLVFGAIGGVGWHAPDLFLHDRNGLVDREVAALEGRLGTGIDAAGHDRRVPRAWFLARTEPRRPTLFHAALIGPTPAGPITGPSSPGFADAVRAAMRNQVLSQPGEEALLAQTVVEVAPLAPDPELPPGAALLLWRRAPDAATARRFWTDLGFTLPEGP